MPFIRRCATDAPERTASGTDMGTSAISVTSVPAHIDPPL